MKPVHQAGGAVMGEWWQNTQDKATDNQASLSSLNIKTHLSFLKIQQTQAPVSQPL